MHQLKDRGQEGALSIDMNRSELYHRARTPHSHAVSGTSRIPPGARVSLPQTAQQNSIQKVGGTASPQRLTRIPVLNTKSHVYWLSLAVLAVNQWVPRG